MPQGRVKDPEGNQSNGYDFGYVRRNNFKWPDGLNEPRQNKVIPFYNRKLNSADRIYPDPGPSVQFAPVPAEIHVKLPNGDKKPIGTIGIAVLSTQTDLIELLGLDPEAFN